jgi:hypothetical protein
LEYSAAVIPPNASEVVNLRGVPVGSGVFSAVEVILRTAARGSASPAQDDIVGHARANWSKAFSNPPTCDMSIFTSLASGSTAPSSTNARTLRGNRWAYVQPSSVPYE